MCRTIYVAGEVRAVRPDAVLGTLSKRIAASYRKPRAVVVSEHEVHFRAQAIPGIFGIKASVLLGRTADGMAVKVSGRAVPEAGAYVLLALQLVTAADLVLVPGSGLRSLIPLLAVLAGTAILHNRATRPLTKLAGEVIGLYR